MKDLTVVASTTSSVTFVCNTSRIFEALCRVYPDTFVQTTQEVQTIDGPNFRRFEDICWRNGITLADAR